MNYIELRKLSLEFRRLSSNLLNSNIDNADVNLSRFLKFIKENKFIFDILNQTISNIEYDFKRCFLIESSGWSDFNIPTDEACHIKAQYDYMNFIDTTEKMSVRTQAMHYPFSEKSINGKIQKFLDKAFKSLIDFINDQISMEMIIFDEERRSVSGNTYIQNIDTVNGSANQQTNGTINSVTINNDNTSILSLAEKIISSLSSISEVDEVEIESVKDDLEVIQEQLKSESPKKSRLSKALNGVKKFVKDFSMKLAVSVSASAVTGADWNMLIQQLDTFISNLNI